MKNAFLFLAGLVAVTNVSYAAEPIGYAMVNGTTTGGAGGRTVTVSTLSALKSAAGSTEKLIIQISGTIRGSEGIRVKSNKTFLGINGATLDGPGLLMYTVSNIIVRNIKFINTSASDAITIKSNTHHVWVDHCSFFSVKYDGALDITDGSDFVTVSWNHFRSSSKNSLVAGGPDNPNDKGRLRVTYYYNYFDRTVERNPSYGTGRGHVFNNYYVGNSYGVASRYGAIVRVENNYFEDVDQPLINASADTKHGQFSGVSTNIFRSSGANKIRTTASTWVPTEYSYKSMLIPAADVPNFVMKGAGVKGTLAELDEATPRPTTSPSPSPSPSRSPSPKPSPSPSPTLVIASPLPSGCAVIPMAEVTSDTGYAYRLRGMTQGDTTENRTLSNMRLFENTRELGPAHSYHSDIRTYGKGRFSHSNYNLRFSASDNTNPKSNGRKYIHCMGKSPLVWK